MGSEPFVTLLLWHLFYSSTTPSTYGDRKVGELGR